MPQIDQTVKLPIMLTGIAISHPIRGIIATIDEMIVIKKTANNTYKNPMK